MFTGITENEKKELTKALGGTYYNFPSGISFMRYVSTKGALVVVEKGEVDVVLVDEDGNQMLFEKLVENSVFSHNFYPTSLMIDLVAKTDVQIIAIDQKKIAEYPQTTRVYQQFMRNLAMIYSEKIILANERIGYLTCKTIRSKLLRYFQSKSQQAHSRTFRLPFTYTTLADYLAIDRSAMNRELKNLKDERVIATQGRRVTLLLKDFIHW